MRRGDVFTVSMHGSAGKPRPGIIVQADELIRSNRPVLVCPLTSDLVPGLLSRPEIAPSVSNGLRVPSQAMADRVTSALPREIGKVVGYLSDDELERIDFALMIVFGLMRRITTPRMENTT